MGRYSYFFYTQHGYIEITSSIACIFVTRRYLRVDASLSIILLTTQAEEEQSFSIFGAPHQPGVFSMYGVYTTMIMFDTYLPSLVKTKYLQI